MQVPHWLIQTQVVLSSVSFICAIVGVSVAWYDWVNMRERDNDLVSYRASIPMFVLVCATCLFYTPVRLSQLLYAFHITPLQEGLMRAAALAFICIYFYCAMLRRLRAYQLPRNEALRRAGATFLGMLLVAWVGFYA